MLITKERNQKNIRSIKVTPVVIDILILFSTSKKWKNCMEALRVSLSTTLLQKTALLRTARILKMKFAETGMGEGKKDEEVERRRKGFKKLNICQRM